jgi:adenylate cyclase
MTVQPHTFMFADISGYSLLVELEGDDVAADVALRFVAVASRLASHHQADVVKCLGDGVMIHASDASESLLLGLDLLATWAEDPESPPIHIGVNTGPAIARAHDWWGGAVNIAARVAAAAGPGQLLLTQATRLAAGDVPATRLRALGSLRAKNIISPVTVYSASRVGALVRAGTEYA